MTALKQPSGLSSRNWTGCKKPFKLNSIRNLQPCLNYNATPADPPSLTRAEIRTNPSFAFFQRSIRTCTFTRRSSLVFGESLLNCEKVVNGRAWGQKFKSGRTDPEKVSAFSLFVIGSPVQCFVHFFQQRHML